MKKTIYDETLQAIGEKVIEKFHPQLMTSEIMFLFADDLGGYGGRFVLGRVRRANPVEKMLYKKISGVQKPLEFVVLLDFPSSVYASEDLVEIKSKILLRTIDHELCHIRVQKSEEGEEKKKLVGHDFEDFKDVIERWGILEFVQNNLGDELVERLGDLIATLNSKLNVIVNDLYGSSEEFLERCSKKFRMASDIQIQFLIK